MESISISPKTAPANQEVEYAEIFSRLTEFMVEGASLVEMVYDETGKPITYVYLDLNPAWENQTGLSRENIIGKTHAEIFPQDTPDFFEVLEDILRSGVSRRLEFTYDNQQTFDINAFKIAENKLGFIFSDVTKKNRDATHQAWLASFPENNPRPVLEIDSQGLIVFQNRVAANFQTSPHAAPFSNELLNDIAPYLTELVNGKTGTEVRDIQIDSRWFRQSLLFLTDIQHLRIYSVEITDQVEAQRALKRINDQLEDLLATRTSERDDATRIVQQNIEEKTNYESRAYARERRQFETLIDLMPAYLVVLTPDHEIISANRYFREEFGAPDGVKCYHCLFNRDRPCEVCESFKPLTTLEAHEWEWEGPNGKFYDVHDFPFMLDDSMAILEIGLDITESKKAQKNLIRMNRYNRGLIEINMDALMTVKSSGHITDVNETAIAATKLPREELIGTRFIDLFSDPTKASAGFEMAFKNGRVKDFELELVNKNNKRVPVAFDAVVFRNEEGETIEIFASLRDQTETKQREEELRRLNKDLENLIAEEQRMHDQLVQAEKLAALGRMLASITHEINNPLQTIKNSLYLVSADMSPENSSMEYVEIATTETRRISNLVAQLREIYKPSKTPKEITFNLIKVVDEVSTYMDAQFKNGNVEVIIQPAEPGCWDVQGEEDQVKQVFINIFNNAFEIMQPVGGKLNIAFSRHQSELCVVVRDSGPGISPEYFDVLFEPFQTTKPKGVGLGLAISYEIVQRHGGRLIAQNYDGGAEFSVWLPAIS